MENETSVSGIISIVFGVVSLLFFPVVTGAIGIVCGLCNLKSGLNKAGITISIIGMILGLFIACAMYS